MPALNIIVPCYNESKRLDIKNFIDFAVNSEFTFTFIDDGSTDNTFKILEKASIECSKIKVIRLSVNVGKAEAIRQGILNCMKDKNIQYIGYLDADLATPLEELNKMSHILCDKENDFYGITGLRLKRLGSNVYRSNYRHYLGRVFATFVSIILGLPTYDTQCGAKIFARSVFDKISPEPFISNWFFDVEILFRIKKEFGKEFVIRNIYEYPLDTWKEMKGSKLKLKHYFLAPFELVRMYFHYAF